MLNRDAILGANDRVIETVGVPEWGDTICVRAFTGTQRDEFEQSCVEARAKGRKRGLEIDARGIKIKAVISSVCDEAGNLLFTEADAEALNAKSAAAIERIYRVVQRISGLLPEDIEELAGNSASGLSESSGSV